MTISDDPKHLRSGLIRGLGLGVVLLALMGLILAGGQLVRAGLPAEMAQDDSPAEPQQPVSFQPAWVASGTYTAYLPLAFSPCYLLGEVSVGGPSSGTMFFDQTFTASALPDNVWVPVTYTWRAAGQTPIVIVGGLSSQATFTWDLAGAKVITVEAVNQCGVVRVGTFTHTVTSRGLVAFERRSDSSEFHDIFIMYNDGSHVQNVTNFPTADDGAPSWSPDGNLIVFASTRVGNGNRAIYKIDLQTRDVTPLTDGTYDDFWPAWSPNGDRIAFVREMTDPSQLDIWVMDTDGTDQLRLTTQLGGDQWPAWSPDGQWIVYSSEYQDWMKKRDLWLVPSDGSQAPQVLLRTDCEGGCGEGDRLNDEIYPTWGPGGWIYYTLKQSKDDQLIYRIKPGDTAGQKFFGDNYNRWIVSWAPDGHCLVFYSYMGGPDKEVWKWCDHAPTQFANLTNNEGISDEFCAWSPVP